MNHLSAGVDLSRERQNIGAVLEDRRLPAIPAISFEGDSTSSSITKPQVSQLLVACNPAVLEESGRGP